MAATKKAHDATIDAIDAVFSGIDNAKGLLGVLKDGLFIDHEPVAVVPYSAENLLCALDAINGALDNARKNARIVDKVRTAIREVGGGP